MDNKKLIFNRSEKGHEIKFEESLKIIEYSIMLVEFFRINEFNNVLASQLRLLLHDINGGKDNSLIKKVQVQDDPTLYPVSDKFYKLDDGSEFISGVELFDYSKAKVNLSAWLNQVIYKIRLGENKYNLTIKDFIRFSANKSGGVHVDSDLREKALVVDVHRDRFLSYIAKGVLKSLNRDPNESFEENFKHILNKFKEHL